MRRISVLGIAAMLSRTSWSIKATERLARLMRVTRLVSVFPELRLIIGTMLRSIPSMGHVIMLLSLLLYVYAVLGFYLFRDADAEHWGTLGAALLTLFQMLTLEGWVEVQDGVLSAMPWAWLYFGSFIFVGVFVVVNLFIAVVINNLESVKREQQVPADGPRRGLLQMIDDIRTQLDGLERQVRSAPDAAGSSRGLPAAAPARSEPAGRGNV